MQVVCRAELGSTHLHGHKVEVCAEIHRQAWCQLYITAESYCLCVVLFIDDLPVGELISLSVAERVVDVDRPRYVRISIIQPSSRNVFSGYRVVIYSLVVVCRPAAFSASVISVDLAFSREGIRQGHACIGKAQKSLAFTQGKPVDASA